MRPKHTEKKQSAVHEFSVSGHLGLQKTSEHGLHTHSKGSRVQRFKGCTLHHTAPCACTTPRAAQVQCPITTRHPKHYAAAPQALRLSAHCSQSSSLLPEQQQRGNQSPDSSPDSRVGRSQRLRDGRAAASSQREGSASQPTHCRKWHLVELGAWSPDSPRRLAASRCGRVRESSEESHRTTAPSKMLP